MNRREWLLRTACLLTIRANHKPKHVESMLMLGDFSRYGKVRIPITVKAISEAPIKFGGLVPCVVAIRKGEE